MTLDDAVNKLAADFDRLHLETQDQLIESLIIQGIPPDDFDTLIAVGREMYLEWRARTLPKVREKLASGETGWHV